MASADYRVTPAAPARRATPSDTLASRCARVSATSPLSVCQQGGVSQCARRWCATHRYKEVHRQCSASISQSRQHDPAALDRKCFRPPPIKLPAGQCRSPTLRGRAGTTSKCAVVPYGYGVPSPASLVAAPNSPSRWRIVLDGASTGSAAVSATLVPASGLDRWQGSRHHRFRLAWAGGLSQCAQFGFAMRRCRRGTSPVLRRCQSVRCAQTDGTTLRRSIGSAPAQQRSRARHPAHRGALCAGGREPGTTAFQYAQVCGISQLARRSTAIPSPVATTRLRHRAGCAIAGSVVMLGRQSFLCADPTSPLSPDQRPVAQPAVKACRHYLTPGSHGMCFASVILCAGAQRWCRLACASCWISRSLRLGLEGR